jgi:hypothetical protein
MAILGRLTEGERQKRADENFLDLRKLLEQLLAHMLDNLKREVENTYDNAAMKGIDEKTKLILANQIHQEESNLQREGSGRRERHDEAE